MTLMKKRGWIVLVVLLGAGTAWLISRPRAGEAPVAAAVSKVPTGPAPPLAPGFPPTFPNATITSGKTDAVEGGWQRIYSYSAKGNASDIVAYYRKELRAAGFDLMAEGAGTYGAMLRAQDKSGKRSLSVDVDAPEEAPKQAPVIKVVIFDIP